MHMENSFSGLTCFNSAHSLMKMELADMASAFGGHTYLNCAHPVTAAELADNGNICPKLRFGVHVDASKTEVKECYSLEMLSLEDAVASLERMAELPSVDDFIYVIHKCREKKNLVYAKQVHMHIHNYALQGPTVLGSYLVPMFVECGSVSDAKRVFHQLSHQNEHCWTSLIQGYVGGGKFLQALDLFEKMQKEGVCPSMHTFIASMVACTRLKCVERGRTIHTKIAKEGFEKIPIIGNTLIDFYAKCSLLIEAQEVLDELMARDVVSWNALITGYAEHKLSEESLTCLKRMEVEGVLPNSVTFICILKALGSIGVVDKGQLIHFVITQEGFERDSFVGNSLVDMYAKCGALAEAQAVFEELVVQDVVSWNALITGYAEHGFGEEALECFEQMQLDGVSPNAVTFVCIFKACGCMKSVDRGQAIHALVARAGYEKDVFVGNALVDMYSKRGALLEAQKVFDELPSRSVLTWTSLITGYAEHGLGEESLDRVKQMSLEGASPDAVMFVCSLKACSSMQSINRGREMHAEIAKEGFERDSSVGSTLVDMYGKFGLLAEAREVLDELPSRNVVSWSTLISGYAEHGLCEEALNCMEQMQVEGVRPNTVTYLCILKACGGIGAIDRGRELHSDIVKEGFEGDPLVGSTIVDMYAKCCLLAEAQAVFKKLHVQDVVSWTVLIAGYAKCGSLSEAHALLNNLPARDVVSWNALIAGYTEHGPSEGALQCLEQMQVEGQSPNAVTFVCIIKACANIEAIEKGQEIHDEIAKEGFECESFVGNSLVDMYAKFGLLAEARDVFEELPCQDVVSWSTLIAGYADNKNCDEAINCFEQMQLAGVFPNLVSWNAIILGHVEQGKSGLALVLYNQMQEQGLLPDSVTFLSILKACSDKGALEIGERVHGQLYRLGGLEDTRVDLENALIDMYGKCGSRIDAEKVFHSSLTSDLVGWNALITGYAHQGESELVFHSFDKMRKQGIMPDGITILSILSVCSHKGYVDKGQKYFEAMSKEYGITPTIKHYNCMIDLLSRAGRLDEAVTMLKKMPFQADLVTWLTILAACRKWGNMELGRKAFEQVVNINEKHDAAFIAMANIYANAHMWEEAKKIDAMRIQIGARKV